MRPTCRWSAQERGSIDSARRKRSPQRFAEGLKRALLTLARADSALSNLHTRTGCQVRPVS